MTDSINEHTKDLERSNFQVDLTNLKASEEEKRNIEKLFRDYSDVFSKSDLDTGYTDTVTHQIKLNDEIPVNLPYRRISPTQFHYTK